MDASQMRAATFPIDAPLLLEAGAGSGKTQAMAARIVHLLESGVPARSILGICFTRQAAETLRERVRAILPPFLTRQARALKLKTFHAFGLECLRRFGNLPADTQVMDARRQRELARQVVLAHALREKSSEAVTELVDYVNRVKTMKAPPISQSDPNMQEAYLFPRYQKLLHEVSGAIDFGDLQQLFYELLRPVSVETAPLNQERESDQGGSDGSSRGEVAGNASSQQQQRRLVPSPVCEALRAEYTHFVVDEFQDFNEIQVELLALLAGDACRVTCVGDPNQCIYTWRGAMPNVFDVWKRRFPHTTLLTLELNYRSDGPIVEATNKVVKASQLAYHHREERAVTLVKCAKASDEESAVPLVLEHVLRRCRDPQLDYGDIAILCRTRRRVKLFLDVLTANRIPVRQLKSNSVDCLSTMRSLLAFLRLCLSPHGPEGNADVRTVLNTAPKHRLPAGVSKKFFLALDSVCQSRRDTEAAQIRAWHHTVSHGSLDDDDDSKEPHCYQQNSNNSCVASGSGADSNSGVLHVASQRGRGPAATAPALGVHPEAYSFFALLRELVYHNFSREAFPKLEVSKNSQKVIRHLVQLVMHAKEMLERPSCDVEQVLRYVMQEGGYDSESALCAVATRNTETGSSSGGGGKRQRDGDDDAAAHSARPKRVGALLMEQCAAQHNEQQQQQQHGIQQQRGWHRESSAAALSRRSGAASAVAEGGGGGGFDDDVLPPAEEAAMWREQRMNLPELVLHTYQDVHEALQGEVALQVEARPPAEEDIVSSTSQSRASASLPVGGCSAHALPPHPPRPHSGTDDSVSVFSTGSGTSTPTLMQALCPPTVVLRRVLDEFVSLVASDDFGPLGRPEKTVTVAAAAGSAASPPPATTSWTRRWTGRVTVGTVHSAKGMEWPAVLVPGCWVGEYPANGHPEEKRVFYVAMSRAMKHLICLTAETTECDGKGDMDLMGDPPVRRLESTPFLNAVGDKLEVVSYTALKQESLKERGYM